MRVLRTKKNGFTLIEALVAFAILALVLSGVFLGVSGAAQNDVRAEFMVIATRFAQSRTAMLGVSTPLDVGVMTGIDEGLAWEQTVRLHSVPDRHAPTVDATRQVYWIKMSVWSPSAPVERSPIYTFETAKIIRTGSKS